MGKDSNNSKFNNVTIIVMMVVLMAFVAFTLIRTGSQPPQDPAKTGSLKKMIQEEAEKKDSEAKDSEEKP